MRMRILIVAASLLLCASHVLAQEPLMIADWGDIDVKDLPAGSEVLPASGEAAFAGELKSKNRVVITAINTAQRHSLCALMSASYVTVSSSGVLLPAVFSLIDRPPAILFLIVILICVSRHQPSSNRPTLTAVRPDTG